MRQVGWVWSGRAQSPCGHSVTGPRAPPGLGTLNAPARQHEAAQQGALLLRWKAGPGRPSSYDQSQSTGLGTTRPHIRPGRPPPNARFDPRGVVGTKVKCSSSGGKRRRQTFIPAVPPAQQGPEASWPHPFCSPTRSEAETARPLAVRGKLGDDDASLGRPLGRRACPAPWRSNQQPGRNGTSFKHP